MISVPNYRISITYAKNYHEKMNSLFEGRRDTPSDKTIKTCQPFKQNRKGTGVLKRQFIIRPYELARMQIIVPVTWIDTGISAKLFGKISDLTAKKRGSIHVTGTIKKIGTEV